MLFGYPIEAVANNWLHDCIVQAVQQIHGSGGVWQSWEAVFDEPSRQKLRRREDKLTELLQAYAAAFLQLTEPQRQQVVTALAAQNQIADLLAARSTCEKVSNLGEPIQAPSLDLFTYCFEALSGLGIRDEQYAAIYKRLPARICSFCGLEYFEAPVGAIENLPDAPREALDHYLSKSKYPFAACNLRNLAPMGHKCNSAYKLQQDILEDDQHRRRRAFDPYGVHATTIDLLDSDPFGSVDGSPQWVVKILPDTPEAQTWDSVFEIKTRYIRDVLKQEFKDWLRGFQAFCKRANRTDRSVGAVATALKDYADYQADNGFADRAFLKAAAFRMLEQRCLNGDARLLELIRDHLPPTTTATA